MSKANDINYSPSARNHNQGDSLLASGMEDIPVITDDIAYKAEVIKVKNQSSQI